MNILLTEYPLNLCLLRGWIYFHQWWHPYKISINSRVRCNRKNIEQVSRLCRSPDCTICSQQMPRATPGGCSQQHQLPQPPWVLSYRISTFAFYSSDLCRYHCNPLSAAEELWHRHQRVWPRAASGVRLSPCPAPPETAVWPWQGASPLCASVSSPVTQGSTCPLLRKRPWGINRTIPGTR